MWDYETGTYWDHITGKAVHGVFRGSQLDVWGIVITTVRAAKTEYPGAILYRSDHFSLKSFLFSNIFHRKNMIDRSGRIPPTFRQTMKKVDARLPEMTQGLGLFDDQAARFYPMEQITLEGITDEWQGRPLHIARGAIDRVPFAVFLDTDERPMQLLTRWYGFILTFPEAEVFTG